jgi:hypothetical protein
MAKKTTLRQRAEDWIGSVTPHEMASSESFAIAAYEAGHRANRLAKERAVVKAAAAYTKHLLKNETGGTAKQRIAEVGRRLRLWKALEKAVIAYERAKGGAR